MIELAFGGRPGYRLGLQLSAETDGGGFLGPEGQPARTGAMAGLMHQFMPQVDFGAG